MVSAHQPRADGSLRGAACRAALQPVATLYVGKLIIDEVVLLVQVDGRPIRWPTGWRAALIDRLALLIAAEFALAVAADGLRPRRRAHRRPAV